VFNPDDVVAIDIHTHAEEACGTHADDGYAEFQAGMQKYFHTGRDYPPEIPETAQYFRERNIGAVIFCVDCERETGFRRYNNEEMAELTAEHDDILIPFASIDPHKGKMGLREARRMIEDYDISGFKFHPTVQGFFPNDRMAYPYYELIAEAGLPAIFHSGHSGIGTGMPGGGGMRLKYSNPMHLDDVAADFPDMTVIIAHPSFPWQDESLSVCLHKPNVYIDLSGWSPKYFPPQLVHYANTMLRKKMLFGSDFPLIRPDRWLSDFEEAGFRDEVRPLILKDNAVRMLGLKSSGAG